jgi:hypothetical protein
MKEVLILHKRTTHMLGICGHLSGFFELPPCVLQPRRHSTVCFRPSIRVTHVENLRIRAHRAESKKTRHREETWNQCRLHGACLSIAYIQAAVFSASNIVKHARGSKYLCGAAKSTENVLKVEAQTCAPSSSVA